MNAFSLHINWIYIMDSVIVAIIVFGVLVGLLVYYISSKESAIRKEQERIKELEKNERRKDWQKKLIQAENDFANLLDQRVKELGCLTKRISFAYEKENDIFVYEESKTIFIMGKKYMFNDILSCNIEKKLYKKGKTTHITTPDKGEMITQELLYGYGKKYNVKSTTEVVSTPDLYRYIVYIGLNSISSPQIYFEISSIQIANEINNLMNVIINYNKS